ncbi:hypothetical protein [Paenibacillus mucilaginosus]|nr:hypothetical protein [Paenibacillus mucilaginosus]
MSSPVGTSMTASPGGAAAVGPAVAGSLTPAAGGCFGAVGVTGGAG